MNGNCAQTEGWTNLRVVHQCLASTLSCPWVDRPWCPRSRAVSLSAPLSTPLEPQPASVVILRCPAPTPQLGASPECSSRPRRSMGTTLGVGMKKAERNRTSQFFWAPFHRQVSTLGPQSSPMRWVFVLSPMPHRSFSMPWSLAYTCSATLILSQIPCQGRKMFPFQDAGSEAQRSKMPWSQSHSARTAEREHILQPLALSHHSQPQKHLFLSQDTMY